MRAMIVLGLDTATTGCSVALLEHGRVVALRATEMERGQAEVLNPMIAEVMREAARPYRDLDLVAVTTGPGAFTGLRIGLACARAIAVATGVAVRGVTTFSALAHAVPDAERTGRTLVVAVNGKRRDVFVQMYSDERTVLGKPWALEPAHAIKDLPGGPLLIAGDGTDAIRAALTGHPDAGAGPEHRIRFSSATRPPDAVHVAFLATEAAAEGPPDRDRMPRPFYIRPPDARRPTGEGRRGQ